MTRASWCAVAAVTSVVVVMAVADPVSFWDMMVYRTGGAAWAHGVPLYTNEFPSRLPFTYPPVAAVLFSLFAMVPKVVAVVVVTVAGLVALSVTTTLAARTWLAGTIAIACAFAVEPVRSTLEFGQVNLVLMGLVALDCLLPRTRWPRGMLIGIAAAIKLTPAVFVLFFLARHSDMASPPLGVRGPVPGIFPPARGGPVLVPLRAELAERASRLGLRARQSRCRRPAQHSAAVTVVTTFAAVTGFGMLMAPADSVRYWHTTIFATDRIGGAAFATNQSLRGGLSRLDLAPWLDQGLWLALVAVVLVLTWQGARRTQDPVTALFVVAAGALLVSPVSWSHHWVWIVPAVAVWVVRGGRAGPLVTLAVFAVGHKFLPNAQNRELAWTWWQQLVGNSYLLAASAFLVWSCVERRVVHRMAVSR